MVQYDSLNQLLEHELNIDHYNLLEHHRSSDCFLELTSPFKLITSDHSLWVTDEDQLGCNSNAEVIIFSLYSLSSFVFNLSPIIPPSRSIIDITLFFTIPAVNGWIWKQEHLESRCRPGESPWLLVPSQLSNELIVANLSRVSSVKLRSVVTICRTIASFRSCIGLASVGRPRIFHTIAFLG